MGSARVLAVAAAAAFASIQAANAADLPPLMAPMPRPPILKDFSGWYLRGDIGMSNQGLKNINHPSFATAPQFTFLDAGGFSSGMFFGLGVGYEINNWLRVDVTGEYRGKTQFRALDRFLNGANFNTNEYTATKSEWVGLFNAYLDLGTWWCITPFIGAGVGAAYNTIDHFRDTNVIAGGGGWASSGSKTNLAWALHAGAAYKVTPGLTVELAYRYLNLGSAQTGLLVNLDPTFSSGNPLSPVTFNNIDSHDVKFGIRWQCCEPEPPPPPPLMRKG